MPDVPPAPHGRRSARAEAWLIVAAALHRAGELAQNRARAALHQRIDRQADGERVVIAAHRLAAGRRPS